MSPVPPRQENSGQKKRAREREREGGGRSKEVYVRERDDGGSGRERAVDRWMWRPDLEADRAMG